MFGTALGMLGGAGGAGGGLSIPSPSATSRSGDITTGAFMPTSVINPPDGSGGSAASAVQNNILFPGASLTDNRVNGPAMPTVAGIPAYVIFFGLLGVFIWFARK